jgi:EmrB/QacA subfamily drug resistance transporter
MHKWGALVVLSLAQFLMVLDQAVMNVSISQLVDDFGTSVTTIQGVITFYSLTMATLMITGGKVGDIVGRRRTFVVGLVVYGLGSALTAVSWSVGALLVGWSVLEGVGAALVLPALVALVAANYEGRERVAAFGVIGGVSGAGIAVGPIVGGYFTSELSWRWVFVGEVVIAIVIVLLVGLIRDAPVGRKPRLDVVGAVLTALGLGMIVYGALQSSSWGWVRPKRSPVEPFGFSLTLFLIAAGFGVLWLFARWQERRRRRGEDPLVKMELLRLPALRSGLASFLAQNTILLGIFFILPLYFQIVLGLDALETGIRMLPISIAMLVTSMSGPALARRIAPRRIVQGGFVTLVVAAFALLGQIEPELDDRGVMVALVLLGIGMGLIASQLGNVVQSAVGTDDRGEAGGLQYTAQQLGSALGTALIGAIVLSALVGAFLDNVEADPAVPAEISKELAVRVGSGASFVPADAVEGALQDAGLDEPVATAIVDDYEEAQLAALEGGLLVAGFIALAALPLTRDLPTERSGSSSRRVEHLAEPHAPPGAHDRPPVHDHREAGDHEHGRDAERERAGDLDGGGDAEGDARGHDHR